MPYQVRTVSALQLEEIRKIAELMQFLQLEMGQLQFELKELEEYKADLLSKIEDTYSTYQSAVTQNKEIAARLEEQYGKDCKIDLETGLIN